MVSEMPRDSAREERHLISIYDAAVTSGEIPIPFAKAIERIERARAKKSRRDAKKKRRPKNRHIVESLGFGFAADGGVDFTASNAHGDVVADGDLVR